MNYTGKVINLNLIRSPEEFNEVVQRSVNRSRLLYPKLLTDFGCRTSKILDTIQHRAIDLKSCTRLFRLIPDGAEADQIVANTMNAFKYTK